MISISAFSGSSSILLILSPILVPPGSLVVTTEQFFFFRKSLRKEICVVLPQPSMPSKVIKYFMVIQIARNFYEMLK